MSTRKRKAPILADVFTSENKANEKPEVVEVREKENIKSVFTGANKEKIIKSVKKSTTIYIPIEMKEKLEEIQFSERKSGRNQNDLILEGIELLFKNRGFSYSGF
jgi:hypothetical protein